MKTILLLLFFLAGLSACKAEQGGEAKTTPQITVTQQGNNPEKELQKEGTLTERELFLAACEALACSPEEWKGLFPETAAEEAVLLLVPDGAKAAMVGAYAEFSMKTQDTVYLVMLDRTTGRIAGEVMTECGISQMGISAAEGKTWIGFVYQDRFAGWEEYGMKQYCFDGTERNRVCRAEEAEDMYAYWKDRKPVFGEDGTIEIYKRSPEAGTFEALVQNRDIKSFDHYENYVAAYTWEPEQTFSVAAWEEACVPYEIFAGKSGPEIIRDIFLGEAAGTLPEKLWFSVGYDGAVVTDYIREDAAVYFMIKKYGGAHQAGFQSLCAGSLNREGKIEQCRLYAGDRAQTAVVGTETGKQILFYTETESTGILSASGGILQAEGGVLTQIWPLTQAGEPDGAYWNNRTARIKDNRLEIYRVEYQENELGTIGGYELKLEEVKKGACSREQLFHGINSKISCVLHENMVKYF